MHMSQRNRMVIKIQPGRKKVIRVLPKCTYT